MIQIAESHVQRVLDQMRDDVDRADDEIMRGLSRDMAVGAVHFAMLAGLIDTAEFSLRCEALRWESA